MRNRPQTSNAPIATVAMASIAPRAPGDDRADPVERAGAVEDCRCLLPVPCSRSPSDCKAVPSENDDFDLEDAARDFGWAMMVGSATDRGLDRDVIGGITTRGSVSPGRTLGSSRRIITVGSIASAAGPL